MQRLGGGQCPRWPPSEERIEWRKLKRAIKSGDKKGVERALAAVNDYRVNDTIGSDKITPLIFAAQKGNLDIVKVIFNAGGSIDFVGRESGGRPLHYACRFGHIEIVRFLVEQGADMDFEDRERTTALFWASQAGHLDIVHALLQYGADINKGIRERPLHGAAACGHVAVVRALIQKGADVNADIVVGFWGNGFTAPGRTALHQACEKNQKEVVEVLLSCGAEVNSADVNGVSSLHIASREGFAGVVKLLLKHGADVNPAIRGTFQTTNDTVLDLACQSEQEEVVRMLLKHGADIEKLKCENMKFLLYIACRDGLTEVVNTLIKCGTSVNHVYRNSLTPLLAALEHVEVVSLLLKYGADVHAFNSLGENALIHACREGKQDLVEILVGYGAKVNQCDHHVRTFPLLEASRNGLACAVVSLLKAGAEVDKKDRFARTSLCEASQKGYAEVVTHLLEHGANVNHVEGISGRTALHLASQEGYARVVECLLMHGASVDAVNMFNNTALHLGCKYGKREVVKTLLQYGADVSIKISGTDLRIVRSLGCRPIKVRRLGCRPIKVSREIFDILLCHGAAVCDSCGSAPYYLLDETNIRYTTKLYVAGLGSKPNRELLDSKEFQEECQRELAALRAPVNTTFTYLDILMKDPSGLHDPLVEDIMHIDDHRQIFPIYGLILDGHLSLGWKGRLLNRCVFTLQSGDLGQLPPELLRLICHYLDHVSLMSVVRIVDANSRRLVASEKHLAAGLQQLQVSR